MFVIIEVEELRRDKMLFGGNNRNQEGKTFGVA
jgi:hypothetical protein